jgi:Domain of unknown function (DUF4189)
MRIITTALLLLLIIPAAANADGWHRWHYWHHRHWGWNRWHHWELIDDDAPVTPTFGAIAFSPSTGRYGTSWNRLTSVGAQQAAVTACGVGDCTARVTEQDEFAVLVRGSAGVTTAWNPDLATAQQAALTSCSTQSTDCHVVATTHD